MPELPEVETVRNQIEAPLIGSTVQDAGAFEHHKFTPALELVGAKLTKVTRRGKFLICETDDDREFIVHLGMTGRITIDPQLDADSDQSPYLRAWLEIKKPRNKSSRYFHFYDVRRFGRLRVVDAGDYSKIPTLHKMGPEPMSEAFTAKYLADSVAKSSRTIKTQLLCQRPVAGVGNIYADEALWLARISPTSTTLSLKRAERLREAIQVVLQNGLDNGGTTLRDYKDAFGNEGTNQRQLEVYGRSGEDCSRCGTELYSKQIDARTTTWCRSCQT